MSNEIIDIEELSNDDNLPLNENLEEIETIKTGKEAKEAKEAEESDNESEISSSRKKQLIEKKLSMTQEDEGEGEQLEEKFKEALKKYYRLKNEYDESLENQKKKILSMSGLSLKEKRIEFRKLKRKCVNCKRPVGTIFDIKIISEEDKDRHLIALCGDREDPCSLNIDINLGVTKDIRQMLNDLEKELNDYKNQIIKDKNDLLFGYITSEEAVKKFDEIKEDMKVVNELYDLIFENYNQIVDNPKKKENYQNLLKGFYENIDSFKSMIEEYKQSGSTQYVIDAVELYKNEIIPKANEIMIKTYKYNDIDYNEDDNTYHLDQKKNTLQQFEIDMGKEDHGIISLKFGMPQKVRQTASTKIRGNISEERIPSLKSKKRPKLVIKESESDEPVENVKLDSKIPFQIEESESESES